MKQILLCAVLLSSLGCAGSSRLKVGKHVDGEVVEAEGLAPHNPSDLVQTRRASLVDAQKNAVEKSVGVFVSGKTMVEKAVAIENNVLAQTEGYIKKYDILSEEVEGSLHKTRIRALVAIKDLERDLKGLSLLNPSELTRPRLAFDIKESVEKSLVQENSATAALSKTLTEQGYVVLGDNRRGEADLILIGQASSFPFQASSLGGFVSYRARFNVEIRRTQADDIILSLVKEASGLGGNAELAALKSLETVGQLVGTELSTKLSEAWSKSKSIRVRIENVATFSDVDRVRKHLTAQPGVKDLVLRYYEGTVAEFEVELGSVNANELASSLQKSQTFPLDVVEIKSQTIHLKIK